MEVIQNMLSQGLVQRLGWTLVHFVWQAGIVALLLAILLQMLRNSSPNLRYMIACFALAVVVLLPAITMSLISVTISDSATDSVPEPVAITSTPITSEKVGNVEVPVMEIRHSVENVTVSPGIPIGERITKAIEPFLLYVVMCWLMGVFGLSVWQLGGWTQLQRLRRMMVKPVDESLRSKFKELAGILGVHKVVQLMESAFVQAPTSVGWLKPVILLPASVLTGFSADQLEAILAHELAHIKRYDYLVNLLQTVVEILGFYHPAVWWISKKIRVERENCCDDIAVRVSGDSIGYAKILASFEEIQAGQPELAVAANEGDLFRRICRLLGKDSGDSNWAGWIPSVVTMLLIAAIVMPTTFGLTARKETEHSAKFLLQMMMEYRSKVRNLQYVAEENTREDLAARKVVVENQIEIMREKGAPERLLERIKEAWSRLSAFRYQILECTVDDAERVKIVQSGGTYDSAGKKVPSPDKHIWAWDGVVATDFSQRSGSLGQATLKDAPQVVTRLGHPWRTFTGTLCLFLEKAITAGRQVSVDELKDGSYRIAFDYKTSQIVAVIDPSKGYTCALQENYYNGQLTRRYAPIYEKIAGDIWFPVSGRSEEYAPNGTLLSRSTVKSSQIRINDPAFDESCFGVNVPKGALVRDYTRNAEKPEVYRYGEPKKSYDEIVRSQSKFIAGMAVDEDGSLVPGVAVEVCCHKKPRADGGFSLIFGGFDTFNAITDNLGRFAIEMEEDGFYNLRFSPENHAAIVAYDVPNGKSDLKVTLPNGGTISGRVVRIEDGRKVPVPSIEVKAEQSDRSSYSHLGHNRDRKTLTDSQGRFQFNHLRTKMRSAETRNSPQWEYSPRTWKISHKNIVRTVTFYESAKMEDIELVLVPDYTSLESLTDKPPHHIVRAEGSGLDQHY
jgi:beta-lactamase regulating signal transducer with metallopeptidase domain